MAKRKEEMKNEGLDREKLVKALRAVLPGIEKRNTLSGLDTVYFDNDWIRSFNNQISISYPIDVKIQCAIRMEELFKVLTQMGGEKVTIRLTPQEKAEFKDGVTTLKMALRRDVTFDEQIGSLKIPPPDEEDQWKAVPEDFAFGTGLCLWSAAVDLIQGTMAGVYFQNDSIYSTDNNRVSKFTMASSMDTSFILPTVNVSNFLRIGEKPVSFSENKSWAHFLCESGVVISIRKLIGDYPVGEIEEYFASYESQEGEFFTFPDGLEASINRASVLAEVMAEEIGLMAFIFLRRVEDKLVITGKKEIGEVIDELPWENGMPPSVEIMINPAFLKKIVFLTKEFKIAKNGRSIYFEADKFRHLLIAKIVNEK